MFDVKNGRATEQETNQGTDPVYSHSNLAGEEIEYKTVFEQEIAGSNAAFLSSVFGQAMADKIERYMNERGLSIYDVYQDPVALTEELDRLFGEAADMLVDSMLNQAFAKQGFENETFTRFDLSYGVRKLRQLASARSKENEGEA